MAADQPFANCDIGPEIGNVSRRSFIGAFGLGAGALVLGLPLPQSAARAATGGAPERVGTPFGAMLSIAPDGAVTFVCPSSEMGQGTQDALARILAEDLDCAWDTLTVRLPWADPAFINPAARKQLTANSMTVTGYCSMLRKAGASARAMLVAAAAERLGVAASELTTGNGRINHAATNRTLGYGDVAAAAALLPVPAGVALKQAKSFALIGTRRPRKDLLPKVTGTAEYGIDVQQEGMLVAALVLAPHPAATFTAEGLETARALPGVAAVVPVSGGVAVLADRFWRAHKAAAAITLKTATSPLGDLSDASLDAMLHAAFDTVPPQPFPNIDLSSYPFKMDYADKAVVSAAIDGAAHKLDVAYSVPHLAHAAMEPLVCAARLDDGQLLIRGPLQDPETSRQLGATLTGLPLDKVRVEVTFIGGGFGRKWGTDFVGVAVEAARGAPGRLVKTMWAPPRLCRPFARRDRPCRRGSGNSQPHRRGKPASLSQEARHGRVQGPRRSQFGGPADLWRLQGPAQADRVSPGRAAGADRVLAQRDDVAKRLFRRKPDRRDRPRGTAGSLSDAPRPAGWARPAGPADRQGGADD